MNDELNELLEDELPEKENAKQKFVRMSDDELNKLLDELLSEEEEKENAKNAQKTKFNNECLKKYHKNIYGLNIRAYKNLVHINRVINLMYNMRITIPTQNIHIDLCEHDGKNLWALKNRLKLELDSLKYFMLCCEYMSLTNKYMRLINTKFVCIFIGDKYVTKVAYKILCKKINKYKRILQTGLILSMDKNLDDNNKLQTIASFLKLKKNSNQLKNFVKYNKYFYINLPAKNMQTQEDITGCFKQVDDPFFGDFSMSELEMSAQQYDICFDLFNALFKRKLESINKTTGRLLSYPLLGRIDSTKQFIIDHNCFDMDAENIYVKKVIINNYRDISVSCVVGGIFSNTQIRPNYYYHLSEIVKIPFDKLYINADGKRANRIYNQFLSSSEGPLALMRDGQKRFYLIKQAIQEEQLVDILKKDSNVKGQYISTVTKKEFKNKLQSIFDKTPYKGLFYTGIDDFLDKNNDFKNYVLFRSGRRSKNNETSE